MSRVIVVGLQVLFSLPASKIYSSTTFLSVNHDKLLVKVVGFHERPDYTLYEGFYNLSESNSMTNWLFSSKCHSGVGWGCLLLP